MSRIFVLPLILVVTLSICILGTSPVLAADPPQIDWIQGPAVVDLGGVATVNLLGGYVFANGSDTRELMKYVGEPDDKTLVGMIASSDETSEWLILFSYNAVGYIKDDEKDQLNATEILNSIKQATEEANKIRIKNGISAVDVIGWYEEPRYDTQTNNLIWAVLGRDRNTGTQIVNYDTRILGRYGYMAITLVTDVSALAIDKQNVTTVVSNYHWKAGKSYAEWVSGDKVADIGLTALVVGGAGAVAASTGILAKIWKFLVAGIAAIGAAIWRFFKKLTGRDKPPVTPPPVV